MDETPPSSAARMLELLRRAYVERRSGELHIDHGDERRGLAVREGQIVHGRSDVAGERLGDVLVRHGDVSQADLDRAVEAALSERRPLGTVLAEMGLVGRDQLEEAVATHVRTILFAALEEPENSPAFEEIEIFPGEAAEEPASRLSTGQVLLDAARRLEDPAVVREALGDLDWKLVPATDPRLSTRPVGLTPTDGFVLSRVDGTLSACELVGLIPLPPEETEKSLLGLLCTGAVAFAPDRPAARRAPAAPPPVPSAAPHAAAPPAPPAPPAEKEEAAPSPSPGPSPEEVRRLILETHAVLAQRDHFELLGITAAADATELRAAYARLARILHPDACSDPALADVSDQREEVFLKVCEAYETLHDPAKRADYEADLRRRKPRPAAAPAGTPPPGTPSSASPPAAGSAPSEAALEEAIAAGEELIRSGEYWEAMQQVEPTLPQVEGALRIRARLVLARASMKYPDQLRRAESLLQEVLHEDPLRLEAYLLLGDIYRNSQLRARATAMYRRALDLQPQNRHALRELGRLEEAGTPPPAGGSLLGFLKKR
jgi:hypothetical protein